MYLVGLHGHGTSAWPGSSGAPTECTAATKTPLSSIRRSAGAAHPGHDPHRHGHVGRVGDLHARAGRCCRRAGPCRTGPRTWSGRACSRRRSPRRSGASPPGRSSCWSGPRPLRFSEQMNVRSSTRATSPGSEADQKLFGRSFGFSRVKVPFSTSRPVSRSHSPPEPSHQTTSSGLVSSAMPCTHLASSGRLVSAGSSIRSALNIAISLRMTQRRGKLSRPRSRPGRR